MKFMTNAVLICLTLPCSFMDVADSCYYEQKAVNEVNASILVNQTANLVAPKSTNMQFEGKDGFIQGKGAYTFDYYEGLFNPTLFRREIKKYPKVS